MFGTYLPDCPGWSSEYLSLARCYLSNNLVTLPAQVSCRDDPVAHMPTLHERLSDGVETVQYLQGRVALDWATHTPSLTKPLANFPIGPTPACMTQCAG